MTSLTDLLDKHVHATPHSRDFVRLEIADLRHFIHHETATEAAAQRIEHGVRAAIERILEHTTEVLDFAEVDALNADLREEVVDLKADNAELRQEIRDLEAENTRLRALLSKELLPD